MVGGGGVENESHRANGPKVFLCKFRKSIPTSLYSCTDENMRDDALTNSEEGQAEMTMLGLQFGCGL